jgi:cytochrome b561
LTDVLLIGIVYACMEPRTYFPKGSAMREGIKAWHFTLDLRVLLLVLVRLVVRLADNEPAIQPAPPKWQLAGASLIHYHCTAPCLPCRWRAAKHAAAAPFHHYVTRDNTLQRMLPVRRN